VNDTPLTFACAGNTLVGILSAPPSPPSLGLIIVVGGPQYRAGSHRQFVLLARALAAQGVAVLRFDCRGMGDSSGEFPGFEHIEPDVAAAVNAIFAALPTLLQVALWGLCDATLAMAAHARLDQRVTGLILLNPWVRSEAGLARAQLKHYYLARFMQRDFLHKILKGQFDPIAAARDLLANVARALRSSARGHRSHGAAATNPLAERLAGELQHFRGRILIILSGRDLTAKEFEDAARGSKKWQRIYTSEHVTRHRLDSADHTFSRREWRDQIASWTSEWLRANSHSLPVGYSTKK